LLICSRLQKDSKRQHISH